ncbi:MAG: hypothetical protein KDA47_24825, partial [Planctomycetales bacterium]|nr:hypothetical protein [Planctomycetales bacterium]
MAKIQSSEFITIPLGLSRESELALYDARLAAEREFNQEIWNDPEGPQGKAYYRPPGRPDLTYEEVGRRERELTAQWDGTLSAAKSPRSHVAAQRNAWAWDLAPLADKLDDLTRRMLRKFDLYLCRYIVRLVEADGEKIDWASLELANAGAIVYQLWPGERFATTASITATAKLGGKIGLTPNLEIVSVSGEASADLVWQTEWKWVSTLIKAWGLGDFAAGWEMHRDRSSPFAGDREFYLLLQMPKGEAPTKAVAKVKAKINPRGLFTSYIYDSTRHGPVEIGYQ